MDIDIYFEKMSLISLVSFMVDFVYIYFFFALNLCVSFSFFTHVWSFLSLYLWVLLDLYINNEK